MTAFWLFEVENGTADSPLRFETFSVEAVREVEVVVVVALLDTFSFFLVTETVSTVLTEVGAAGSTAVVSAVSCSFFGIFSPEIKSRFLKPRYG